MKGPLDLEWLRNVQADPDVSSAAFELAFVIMQHVNAKSGTAWPTQQTLANAIGLSERTVRTLVDMLVRRGHVDVQSTGGRSGPNTYRLLWRESADSRKPSAAQNSVKCGSMLPVKWHKKAEAGCRPKARLGGNSVPFRRKISAVGAEASFLQNFPQEPPSTPVGDAVASGGAKQSPNQAPSQDVELYRRGKDLLGLSAGGLIRRLVQAKGGNTALARAALEQASTKADPREYLGAIIAGRERDASQSARDRGDAW